MGEGMVEYWKEFSDGMEGTNWDNKEEGMILAHTTTQLTQQRNLPEGLKLKNLKTWF